MAGQAGPADWGDASGTPIIGPNGAVYVGTTGGKVVAYTRDKGQLVWAVLAATPNHDAGDLAGSYYGVNAEASVVTGGGANVLVGGWNSAFMLEPLSVQAQTGVNLAVTVASLDLVHSYK